MKTLKVLDPHRDIRIRLGANESGTQYGFVVLSAYEEMGAPTKWLEKEDMITALTAMEKAFAELRTIFVQPEPTTVWVIEEHEDYEGERFWGCFHDINKARESLEAFLPGTWKWENEEDRLTGYGPRGMEFWITERVVR
jgi:hypothetical protein